MLWQWKISEADTKAEFQDSVFKAKKQLTWSKGKSDRFVRPKWDMNELYISCYVTEDEEHFVADCVNKNMKMIFVDVVLSQEHCFAYLISSAKIRFSAKIIKFSFGLVNFFTIHPTLTTWGCYFRISCSYWNLLEFECLIYCMVTRFHLYILILSWCVS